MINSFDSNRREIVKQVWNSYEFEGIFKIIISIASISLEILYTHLVFDLGIVLIQSTALIPWHISFRIYIDIHLILYFLIVTL